MTADVLQDARIAIFHMGLDFPFDACGRAFATLPLVVSGNDDTNFLFTNFDMLLYTVSHQLAVDSPPGVWVSNLNRFFKCLSWHTFIFQFLCPGTDKVCIRNDDEHCM